MPRLMIDGTPVVANAKGVGQYAYNLCLQLARQLPEEWDLQILVNRGSVGIFPEPFRGELIPVKQASELITGFWLIPKHADRLKPQVLLKMCESAGYVRGIPTVTICHDIDELIRNAQGVKNNHVRALIDTCKGHYRAAALWNSDYVICNSEFTRQAVHAYYGIASSRTAVAYCAADSGFREISQSTDKAAVRTRYGVKKFVLVFATGDSRENSTSYPLLAAKMAELHLNSCLLVAGLRRPSSYVRKLIAEFRRLRLVEGEHFVFEDFLPRKRFRELAELYAAADFYVELSLHEGFGMQLLEAMACGTTCISSSRGALAEVGGEYVLRVDPTNMEEVALTLRAAYEAGLHLLDNREQVQHTKKYSWETTGRVVSEILQQIVDKSAVGFAKA
jgi:glycosyltransferase involved in cell wall biosynthesis